MSDRCRHGVHYRGCSYCVLLGPPDDKYDPGGQFDRWEKMNQRNYNSNYLGNSYCNDTNDDTNDDDNALVEKLQKHLLNKTQEMNIQKQFIEEMKEVLCI